MRYILAVALALWTAGAAAQDQVESLKFTFIGNTSYEITDGRSTILLDFPYESGANGYMTYDLEKVQPKGDVLCLITHAHSDHFAPSIYEEFQEKSNWTIFAPQEALSELDKPKPIAWENFAQFNDVSIAAIKTPHSKVVHHSYAVNWKGLRIYVAGDTYSVANLARQTDLDVAFVTPWLFKEFRKLGRKIPAERIVIYHQKAGEENPCEECIFHTEQGQTFEIPVY
jgi:hypothetical protein